MAGSRVRQTAQATTDGGATWRTLFDGIYEHAAP
jgi:hypothetical protein